jgi:hypothetical protein
MKVSVFRPGSLLYLTYMSGHINLTFISQAPTTAETAFIKTII